MYILLLVTLLYLGYRVLASGVRARNRRRASAGVLIWFAAILFFSMLTLWGEWLWFDNLGYSARFWTLILAKLGAALLGIVLGGLTGYAIAFNAGVHLRRIVALACGIGGLLWGLGGATLLLLFAYGQPANTLDPLLGLDAGFYLFGLPLLDRLFWLLLFVAVVSFFAALLVWESDNTIRWRHVDEAQGNASILPMANAGLAWVMCFGSVLGMFHLLYSRWGVVQGPGWVDTHVLLPALVFTAVGFVLVGLLPLFPAFRALMRRRLARRVHVSRPAVAAMITVWLAIGLVSVIVLVGIPGLAQWLLVKPNEITFEKPYIAHNIEFTRRGFRLDKIEDRAFKPSSNLTRDGLEANREVLSEVRLWDWRALDAVYRQFQEIRLYYEFADVDVDRYTIGGRYRQLMVSAREMNQDSLSPQSQTFVNKRFKYTHGYGYTAAAVSDFTPEGLPNLLVQDIPPKSRVPELALDRPEIYYGELTRQPVVVNTKEPEFNYPSGETNVYNRYEGRGGVQMSSLWRKFLYGWMFDGSVLLFSSYPTSESRVMFDRQIMTRVEKLAPFLTFDADPYLVSSGGRLYWIVDAYTESTYYPYSQGFDARSEGHPTANQLHGANYVRNAVKAVVDAYNGSVDFYVFDEEDPIIATWRKAFPGLFKSRSQMPPDLVRHVRYPNDFLLVQGLMYSKYHMSDPEVFYNQEDLWVRATEKHYGNVVYVEPYYVMWKLPGKTEPEFVLILPFTPKNKQVLIGWIAGLSDGDDYGRFLAYNFPKDKRMLGPQQVETKIDQDSFLSGQLTLWDQQGSQVLRGNVLAIPLDDVLLYVEPIYLQADTAAYPELRLVAVMHDDDLSYAPTFDEALDGLFAKGSMVRASSADSAGLAREAKAAFEGYLKAQGEGDFQKAASELGKLQQVLDQLVDVPETEQ